MLFLSYLCAPVAVQPSLFILIISIMFKENKGEVLHGILLIVLFSFSAFYIAEFEFVLDERMSISAIAPSLAIYTLNIISVSEFDGVLSSE